MNTAREYLQIPIENINTTHVQARQGNIDKNVNELANSIELQGLFSPVLVVSIDNNRYELIAGQRRMKAYRDILSKKDSNKFSKIPAFVYANLQEWEKKAMSINENFNQEPMSEEDKIAAVTACFNEFGKMTTTVSKTGISYDKVRKYVKYERLPKILKELKTNGKISLSTALETADLYKFDTTDIGSQSEEEIENCALELECLTPKQKKAVKERHNETQEEISKIIDDTKNEQDSKQTITTEVVSDTYVRVEQYKDSKDSHNVS